MLFNKNPQIIKYLRILLVIVFTTIVGVVSESILAFTSLNSKQVVVSLSDYGEVNQKSIEAVLKRAIDDIDGKTLKLPKGTYEIGDLLVENHHNFTIKGNETVLKCGKFLIKDCQQFELSKVSVIGNPEKFAHFDIEGDCENFKIHDCTLTSTPDSNGVNTIYGMRIMCDLQNPLRSRRNSPRNFEVYKNNISNTKYDGILVYALSSNFKVHHNLITNAGCIGIESEGRYGGMHDTKPAQCSNAKIYKNKVKDCGDWGILIMWTDGFEIYDNNCLNNYGCFLSIGSRDGVIKNNVFEGNYKGFEISQEFFKLSNGINKNIDIHNNHIKAMPRDNGRGVIDLRHCEMISFEDNEIEPIKRKDGYMISISSVKNVTFRNNHFYGSETEDFFFKNISYEPDPETSEPVPFMTNKGVEMYNNIIDN